MLFSIRDSDKKAILILGFIIIVVYFPVTILGHSFNPSLNHERFPLMDYIRDYGCRMDCSGPFYNTIDPASDGDGSWPILQLAAKQYASGTIPLWNPYLAAGTPLAADSTNYVFSPLVIFYLLPNYLWDLPLLISVWSAGVFTYYLLRSWSLQFISSIIGSTIFMLSGTFSWFLPHNSVLVVMFTPLILYSIEKTIQSQNYRYVIIGSIAVASSVLGAHLESIVLSFSLSIIYFIFRILQITITKYSSIGFDNQTNKITLINNKTKIFFKVFLIFILGLGLSSFFILPAFEYLLIAGSISHQHNGTDALPYFTILTTFIPYLLGPSLHSYALSSTSGSGVWNHLGGYLPSSCIIFSIIGIIFTNKTGNAIWQKHIALFFFGISILFMLKSIGLPVVNLIGSLPIFDKIIFSRYDGFIWALGFAIATAFGIEVLYHRKIALKHLSEITLISILTIIAMSVLILDYFSWKDAGSTYTILIILQSLFFISASFLSIISYQRNGRAISRIFLLILIELLLYLPFGLPPIFSLYRSLAVFIGSITLIAFGFVTTKNDLHWLKGNKINLLFMIIFCVVLCTNVFVYVESPIGLKIREDEYQSTPVTEFLTKNINYYRIYSFDTAFVPNYPSVYDISTLGLLSAQSVKWYQSFYDNFLDPYAITTMYDYYGWRQSDAPSSNEVYVKYENYYDFLGVKYLISHQTIPDEPYYNIRGQNWYPIPPHESLTQDFVSKLDNVTAMSFQLGTVGKLNPGKVVLTIDSVPRDQTYHRVSEINATEIVNDEFNIFTFEPLLKVKGKEFSISLTYPEANQKNMVAVAVYDLNSTDSAAMLKKELDSNGNPTRKSMAFSILSFVKFPLVFHYGDFNIYENKNVFPRVFFVNSIKIVDSYQSAQDFIESPTFDLKREVALEKPLPTDQLDLLKISKLDNNSKIEITSYEENKINIYTNSKGAAMMILTDTYYPGWKAYIDGKETLIYRADGVVRAIFVPAGNHKIEFVYFPQSFVFGTYLSLGSGIVLAAYYLVSKTQLKSEKLTRF